MGIDQLGISYEVQIDDSSQFLSDILVSLIKKDKDYGEEIHRDR
jgi:hypothetical protein